MMYSVKGQKRTSCEIMDKQRERERALRERALVVKTTSLTFTFDHIRQRVKCTLRSNNCNILFNCPAKSSKVANTRFTYQPQGGYYSSIRGGGLAIVCSYVDVTIAGEKLLTASDERGVFICCDRPNFVAFKANRGF